MRLRPRRDRDETETETETETKTETETETETETRPRLRPRQERDWDRDWDRDETKTRPRPKSDQNETKTDILDSLKVLRFSVRWIPIDPLHFESVKTFLLCQYPATPPPPPPHYRDSCSLSTNLDQKVMCQDSQHVSVTIKAYLILFCPNFIEMFRLSLYVRTVPALEILGKNWSHLHNHNIHNNHTKWLYLARSLGLMVKVDCSWPQGRGFEPQHRILNGRKRCYVELLHHKQNGNKGSQMGHTKKNIRKY
jgi:hypothetical protein